MLNDSGKNRETLDVTNDDNLLSAYMKSRHPIFVINRKGTITDANDVFCKKIGINSDEIIGRNLEEVSFLTDKSKEEV